MRKEVLEAFRFIVKELQRLITDREYYIFNVSPKIEILEQYLLKMSQLENIKSSEALEKLEKIGHLALYESYTELQVNEVEEFNFVKQALLKVQEDEEENKFLYNAITTVNEQYTNLMLTYQEQKRVLEIIFEKKVDIYMLNDFGTLEEYNECVLKKYGTYYQLTQEEFDLLRRLVNER